MRRRQQAAQKFHEPRADQVPHALDVAHDARDQRARFVRIVIRDRQPPDVFLHLPAQLGDHPLRRFRQGFRIATVDRELSFVFLHPNLRNLTISCARIDGAELEHLKSRPLRTPLSSLFLDQCDVSASGLTTILSIPTSLKSLKFFEVSRQGPQIHSLDYSPALLRALSLQRHSLESLCLSLRNPKLSPFTREFDMSSFLALRVLMIRCQRLTESVYPTSLKWATYAPPALDTLVFSGIDFQSRRNKQVTHGGTEVQQPGSSHRNSLKIPGRL